MNQLLISVGPDGPGKSLLEFSQITDPTRSIKGEIEFPVQRELAVSEPYSRILKSFAGNRETTCSGCHFSEVRTRQITTGEAYESSIFFLNAFQRVPQSDLKNDTYRCKMLRTIFIEGMAVDVPFSGLEN